MDSVNSSESKVVEKKILPEYFTEVFNWNKSFEIRKDEDNIQPGDRLVLKEWDGEKYTGRETWRTITYVLRSVPQYGLQEGYCIMCWR